MPPETPKWRLIMNRKTNKRTAGTATAKRPSAKKLRITSRVVDVKRHTKGYVIGGKTFTVAQTRSLASKGQLNGVLVVGKHIQAAPGSTRRLSDLPTRMK